MYRVLAVVLLALVGGLAVTHTGLAQHAPMHHGDPAATAGSEPIQPGQQAFAAIAEAVRLLDADPATDWNMVDLDRLRRHLVDMDEVVMRAAVSQRRVPGGL